MLSQKQPGLRRRHTESKRSPSYYFRTREDLIRYVPPQTKKVLEVGCAGGETGRALRELGVEEVVGIELNEEVAQKGREYYKEIFMGNVEEMVLPFEEEYFDCILYGDVLEHLVNPWKLLKEQSIFLRTGGAVICSIPNIRQYRILLKLVFKGKWEYVEDGILDRSHLRFFTLSSIRSMMEEAGLEIQSLMKRPHGSAFMKALNQLLGNRLIDLLVRQYVVVAVKPGKTEN